MRGTEPVSVRLGIHEGDGLPCFGNDTKEAGDGRWRCNRMMPITASRGTWQMTGDMVIAGTLGHAIV
jgi:hypothetical protein